MRVRVRGVEVAYDLVGKGPLLVLVHGAGDDARMWTPQVEGLAGELTVLAWDEPGAGRSGDVPEGFGLDDYADALAAAIEDAGRGPAIVCGLSWGGTVALALYDRRPDLVRGLVLADTYAGWRGSLPEEEVRARVEGAVAFLAETAPDARPASVRVALRAMAGADLRYVLPRIDVPALLIWGDRDERSPLTVARHFATAIPHAELVVLEGCGHMSNLECPGAFTAALRRFARSL